MSIRQRKYAVIFAFLLINCSLINHVSYCLMNSKIMINMQKRTEKTNTITESEMKTESESKEVSERVMKTGSGGLIKLETEGDNSLEKVSNVGDVVSACYKSIVDSMNPEFCWIKGGNFGTPPTSCQKGWTKHGFLCFENCKRDYHHWGGICWDGMSSYIPKSKTFFSNDALCPTGYYKTGALCYKDCNYIGMENCGLACASSTTSCILKIGEMIIDTVLGVVSFVTTFITAGAASPATSAARNAARTAINQTSDSVIKQAFQRLKTAFSRFFDATVRKAKKAFINNFKELPQKMGVEMLVNTYCTGIYDSIKQSIDKKNDANQKTLLDSLKPLDILGIGDIVKNCPDTNKAAECAKSVLSTASTFDPTGILTIAATFIHPTCEINSSEVKIDIRKINNNFRSICDECQVFVNKDHKGDNKNVIFMDRHPIFCRSGSMLNSFTWKTEGDRLVSEYRCIKSSSFTNNCKDEYTDWKELSNKSNEGSVNFLDRHKVECKTNGQLLRGFQIETNGKDKLRYKYSCCQVNNIYAHWGFSTLKSVANGNWDTDSFSNSEAIDGGVKGALKSFKLNADYGPNKINWDYSVGVYDFNESRDSQYYVKQTNWGDAGEGSIWHLDRHELRCDRNNSALSLFKYERNPNNKDLISFYYECIINKQQITNDCVDQKTANEHIDDNEKKSVHFLDRHRVQCKKDSVLKNWRIERSPRPENFLRINYTCCKANLLNTWISRTDRTDMGNYNSFYLDRQKLSLGPDEAIQAFWLETHHDPKYLNFGFEAANLYVK